MIRLWRFLFAALITYLIGAGRTNAESNAAHFRVLPQRGVVNLGINKSMDVLTPYSF
jgi:hypothetical protein